MINTEQALIELYGPLLTLEQLAELFYRSPQGLRLTLSGNSPFAQRIRPARRKLGRRVYYRTIDIAKVIDEEVGEC